MYKIIIEASSRGLENVKYEGTQEDWIDCGIIEDLQDIEKWLRLIDYIGEYYSKFAKYPTGKEL